MFFSVPLLQIRNMPTPHILIYLAWVGYLYKFLFVFKFYYLLYPRAQNNSLLPFLRYLSTPFCCCNDSGPCTQLKNSACWKLHTLIVVLPRVLHTWLLITVFGWTTSSDAWNLLQVLRSVITPGRTGIEPTQIKLCSRQISYLLYTTWSSLGCSACIFSYRDHILSWSVL